MEPRVLRLYDTDDGNSLGPRRRACSHDLNFTFVADAWLKVSNDWNEKCISTGTPGTMSSSSTVILLNSLVGCIEELQTHVSFLVSQMTPICERTEGKTKPNLSHTQQQACAWKTRVLRRHAWEIKWLKTTVRALRAQQRTGARKGCHRPAKNGKTHILASGSKPGATKKSSCHLVQHGPEICPSVNISPKAQNFCHAMHTQPSAHPGDVTFVKTNWYDTDDDGGEDAAAPVHPLCSVACGRISNQDAGGLLHEERLDTSSTLDNSDHSAAFRRPGCAEPQVQAMMESAESLILKDSVPHRVLSALIRTCPYLESDLINEIELQRESSAEEQPLRQLDKETTNVLSDFGEIPQEQTRSKEKHRIALSNSSQWSGMRRASLPRQLVKGNHGVRNQFICPY